MLGFIYFWFYYSTACYDWCLLNTAWTWAKGNDDMIGCATSISVSASCSRYNILTLASWTMTCFPYVLRILSSWDTIIYSVGTVLLSYASPPVRKTTSPRWCHLWTLQARLPQRPPFSQHVSWRCCNPLGIPSSMVEILLFNSVFHDRVDPVSVSTLKLPLGVIGVVTLKPRASPILPLCI